MQLLTETLSGPAAGYRELIAYKHLNQTPSNTIIFFTTSLIPANKTVFLHVIDVHGHISRSEAFPVDITSLLQRSKAAPTLLPSELEGLTAADIQHLLDASTATRAHGSHLAAEHRTSGAAPRAFTSERDDAVLTNYPNPFNPETWIPYQLANAAEVHIAIYDVRGRLVRPVRPRTSGRGILHREITGGRIGTAEMPSVNPSQVVSISIPSPQAISRRHARC